MDLPIADNVTQPYVSFCQENGLPIGKVPTSKKEMGLQQEMLMREKAPHLFQNIVKPNPNDLPADVKLRYQSGNFWTEDIKPLENAGFTGTASNLRNQVLEAQNIIEQNKLAEMKKRNEARDKAIRERPSGFHPTKNIDFNSPEAVKARRQWGLSDEIG